MEKTESIIDPRQVHRVISRHMLADGMDCVVDFEKSRGSYLFDLRRNEYFLDFFGFFATVPVGYNHPRMTSRSAIEELGRAAVHKPSNSDAYSRELAAFVDAFERLALPDFMKYLFFIEGGAMAVENALKAAFDWKVRKNLSRGVSREKGFQVIHFRQAFHGRSGYTLSLTNTADPRKTQYFPKFDWPRITNPKCVFPLEGDNLKQVQAAEQQALEEIQAVLAADAEDVACLILEPIQGEGGDNHFRLEFHQQLRKICDENEILLIYDEVQTGFGATGQMWACQRLVPPDLIAFGKKSQVCGIMAGPRLDEVRENVFRIPSRINSTWGGNLVDMVRCRMHLEIYQEENLVEKSNVTGKLLLQELQNLQKEVPDKVSNVRGTGLFCAFDLPNTDFRDRFRRRLFENRLIMLGCGLQSVRFRPALNIPQEDVLKGVEIILKTLRQM